MKFSSVLATAVVAVGLFIIGGSAGAVTAAAQCQKHKNDEAGKYAACLQKAESKLVVTFDSVRYAAAIEKCASKFAARWANAESKAAAAGSACPTVGDEPDIRDVTDAHTSDVATLVGGEIVRDCPADRASCEAELAGCPIACGAASARPLQTGLSACFDTAEQIAPCAGTGQDAETRSGLLRLFTDNGDGTITDVRTGLVWEKLSRDASMHDVGQRYKWTNAVTVKIAALNTTPCFAGHCDWRLPNLTELWSLVDLGAPHALAPSAFDTDCAPGCTPGACSCTAASEYWTSSNAAFNPVFAWKVDFDGGLWTHDLKSASLAVRAVRGGA